MTKNLLDNPFLLLALVVVLMVVVGVVVIRGAQKLLSAERRPRPRDDGSAT